MLPGDLHHRRFRCRIMLGWTYLRRRPRSALSTSKASGSGAVSAPPIPGQFRLALQRPLPHALTADDDAARGQHLLDHMQAEWEAKVQLCRLADHLRRETVAGIG